MSLRYSVNYQLPAIIPGARLRAVQVGPPHNCRRLLNPRPAAFLPERPKRHPAILPYVWDYLTPYQRDAWEHSSSKAGLYLYWAAGSGKTLAGLLWSLSGRWPGKTVVVTKANTKGQWKREYEKYSTLHPTILDGEAAGPIDKSQSTVILNWDILPFWIHKIIEWQGGAHLSVIYDEVHRGKNWKRKEKYVTDDGSTRYKSLDNQASAAARLSRRAVRRLGLSATPIRDRVADLWSQLDLIEPDCWGSNWEFVHRYCDARPGAHGGLETSGKSNVKELKLRLREVFHRVTYEEMARELPEKRRQLCYLSRMDQSRPAAFSADLKRAARAGKQALFEVKLLEAASRKRAWIVDVVTDAVASGQKVVVFTGRRLDCERLAESIGKACAKLDAPFWWGHGGTPVQERSDSVAAYAVCQEAAAFVGTTDAFGEAVDGLQHTDLAVFGLLPWTPGQVTQAEGRFSRKGSTRPVLIMYTVAEGTVDEHVADEVLSKLDNVADVLDCTEARGVSGVLSGEADESEIIARLLDRLEGDEDV